MNKAFFDEKFFVLQRVIVPRVSLMNPRQRDESRRRIRDFLNSRPAAIRLKLAVFITLIDIVVFFKCRKPLSRLSPPQQRKMMEYFFDHPVPIFRKAFWGIKTICCLGVYSQESLHVDINYHMRGFDLAGNNPEL